MATTINVPFAVGDTIFHVDRLVGIREATIKRIHITHAGDEQIEYVFVVNQKDTNSQIKINDLSAMFASLGSARVGSEGGGALEAYQALVEQ